MKSYPVGVDVTVTIPIVDLNGDALTPTGLRYFVLDDDGAIVDGPNDIILGSVTDLTEITVVGTLNDTAGARTVQLQIETAAGTYTQETSYRLVSPSRLVILENSFQNYAKAQMLAEDMPDLIGWLGADDNKRISALIEAFVRLTKLAYDIKWPIGVGDIRILIPGYEDRLVPSMWPLMTLDIFNAYPKDFLDALRRGQIAEANQILTGDPIATKLRAGLLSESIGESSMMFRSGVKPLDTGVSRAALTYLGGYVSYRVSITRAP